MTRNRQRLRLVVVSGIALCAFTPMGTATPTAAEGSPIRWLALGDSYSSGEGISGTNPGSPNLQGKEDCVRADGINTNAKAWAIIAYEQATASDSPFSFERPLFVACTGAITDDAATQLTEMRARVTDTKRQQWNVISMSFGGNNIGFASILKGCLDINSVWGFFDLTPGCDVSYRDIADRVDMLVGKRPIDASKFAGRVSLPKLYDQIAAVAAPGAQVIITGYPRLIEEYSRWDYWRRKYKMNCEGILSYDVAMLRRATDYLNQQTKLAAAAATTRWAQRGITFHWVDTAAVYETPNSRHALCSKEPWLNGFTTGLLSGDIQLERSYHPQQTGHTALGAPVKDQVLSGLRSSVPTSGACTDQSISNDLGRPARISTTPGGRCDSDWAFIDTCLVDCMGDYQALIRVQGGVWVIYAYMPPVGCVETLIAVGAPQWVLDLPWYCWDSG